MGYSYSYEKKCDWMSCFHYPRFYVLLQGRVQSYPESEHSKQVKKAKKRMATLDPSGKAPRSITQVDAYRVLSFFVFSVVEAQHMWLELVDN
jgi:hypothetical protein